MLGPHPHTSPPTHPCGPQETGACPKAHEPKCFFDWLHWRSELVINTGQLAGKLGEAFDLLKGGPGSGAAAGASAAATA